jgi:hypothetical protein
MVVIEMNGKFNGYKSCIYRSYVCNGKATKEQKELHRLAHEAFSGHRQHKARTHSKRYSGKMEQQKPQHCPNQCSCTRDWAF